MMEGETEAYCNGGGFCMKVKFWGVRGSLPAPILPNEIENKIVQAVLGARNVDLDDNEAVNNYVSTLPYFQRTTTGAIPLVSKLAARIQKSSLMLAQASDSLVLNSCKVLVGRVKVAFTC
jgi:hypothetical protein